MIDLSGFDHHDHIRELTSSHTHAERYTIERGRTRVTQNHVVRVPSLLHQLEHADPSGRGEERNGGGYESRPAAALEAMHTIFQIDQGATEWLRRLGADTKGETRDLLHRLGAEVRGLEDTGRCHRKKLVYDKATGVPCCRFHQVTRDIASWWSQARIVSGWDKAAWRPDNSCPMCGERGSLRVREVDQIGYCTECHETWTPETIGLLALHITLESNEGRRPHRDSVCWCPVPQPAFEKWPRLCPACGSRYCHRAVASGRMAG